MKLKQYYQTALVAALGLASVSLASAATYPKGDLLVGFTGGTGTDLIYDLGQASSLTNGQTWTLNTLLAGYTLSSVQWGVVGNTTSPRAAWTTTDGTQAGTLSTPGNYNSLNGIDISFYNFFGAAGADQFATVDSTDQNSWYAQTVNPTLTTQYQTIYENPNVTGLSSATLWNAPLATTPSAAGSFALDNTGTLTFTAAPVPEPSTLALLSAGSGLLFLAWRKNNRRSQA